MWRSRSFHTKYFRIQWWNLAAVIGIKKINKIPSQPSRSPQTDAPPPATASAQTRTSPRMCRLPVSVCPTDGRSAAVFVDRRRFLPDPRLSPFPPCVPKNGGQTERSLTFQTAVPCKQYVSPSPNISSQLAWVTYIPNARVHVCMWGKGQHWRLQWGLIVSSPHLLASITFCWGCNIRMERREEDMRS